MEYGECLTKPLNWNVAKNALSVHGGVKDQYEPMRILAVTISIFLLSGYNCVQGQEILPLQRGEDCSKVDYSMNVNLRFKSIPLLTSLQILARFSCNEVRYKDVNDKIISTNYTEVPWEKIITEICIQNELKCWTEAGYLYVLPLK